MINLENPNYELEYKNKKNYNPYIKIDWNYKKTYKKLSKKLFLNPILIYMHPNYYFKATINFN